MQIEEPPLITETFEETDPVTLAKVMVVRHTRGVFTSETRTYTEVHDGLLNMVPPRQKLEGYCDFLRNWLESRGLPTDRKTPHWVKIGDGDWAPYTGRPPIDVKIVLANWITRIDDLTESLSLEHVAGELLYRLIQLLRREGIDDHLWEIDQVITAQSEFRVRDGLNGLAYDAVKTKNGRRIGPKRRKQVAADARLLIRAHADDYWAGHAAMRGDASNTALAILETVNEELKAKALLPAGKDGLSVKTIADHIRASLRA